MHVPERAPRIKRRDGDPLSDESRDRKIERLIKEVRELRRRVKALELERKR